MPAAKRQGMVVGVNRHQLATKVVAGDSLRLREPIGSSLPLQRENPVGVSRMQLKRKAYI